jgi:signal transduction histidine kinase
MVKSLRWRLASSYMLVTLLTATVIGGAAYVLMRQYVDSQEKASLESNAQSVVTQARSLLWPVVRQSDLQSLVTMSSYMGNMRVRVLDLEKQALADSGNTGRADQFLWVLPSGSGMGGGMPMGEHMTFILPMHEPDQQLSENDIYDLYGLSPDMSFWVVRRETYPWGSRIEFRPGLERIAVESQTKGGQVVLVPISESGVKLGYVEVIGDPGFGNETLNTTARVIAIATAGAVLISGGVGLFIAQRVTRPVNHLAEVTTAMSEGDLSIRAPELGKDEIGRLGQGFNKMADSLESSFKALENERDTLRRFVDDASHELRTPITALMNFLELLSGKAKRNKKSSDELLRESLAQVQRLEWITNNLLKLSRFDANIVPIDRQPVKVSDLLEAALSPFKTIASEKAVDLKLTPPHDDFKVSLDRTLILLALSNLLDNAFKFTSQGSGSIELGGEREGGHLRLWVTDNGSGIPPEDLPRVFDRFYRGKNAGKEGSGLGLAIVKSIAEIQGGSVSVESVLGESATFTLRLPLEEVN